MLQVADARGVKLNLLTPQERECLRLVAQQRSSKEIAHELGISKASVDTYCNRARAKLGVTSRREAAQLMQGLEVAAAATAAARVEAPPPPPQPPLARPALVAMLPPVSSLGPLTRLGIIMAGAVVLAMAFGMLLSGLESLNSVVAAAQAHAEAP